MTRPGGRLGMDEWSKGQWQDVLTGRRRWGRDCKRSHGLVKQIDKYSRKLIHWRNKGEHRSITNVITWSNKFRFSILAQVSRGNRSRHWEISEPVSNGHTCDDLWATWYLQCTWTVKNQALSSTSETAVLHAAFPLYCVFSYFYALIIIFIYWLLVMKRPSSLYWPLLENKHYNERGFYSVVRFSNSGLLHPWV